MHKHHNIIPNSIRVFNMTLVQSDNYLTSSYFSTYYVYENLIAFDHIPAFWIISGVRNPVATEVVYSNFCQKSQN